MALTPNAQTRLHFSRLVEASHNVLRARAAEVEHEPPTPHRQPAYFNTGQIGIERMAGLATALCTLRIAAHRYGKTMPHLTWSAISKSMNFPCTRISRPASTAAKRLFQKTLAPNEWTAAANHRRDYIFDVQFTQTMMKNLAEQGLTLQEAGRVMGYRLTPQGDQWRQAHLAPQCPMEGERLRQAEAQRADNLALLRQALARRRAGVGGGRTSEGGR